MTIHLSGGAGVLRDAERHCRIAVAGLAQFCDHSLGVFVQAGSSPQARLAHACLQNLQVGLTKAGCRVARVRVYVGAIGGRFPPYPGNLSPSERSTQGGSRAVLRFK